MLLLTLGYSLMKYHFFGNVSIVHQTVANNQYFYWFLATAEWNITIFIEHAMFQKTVAKDMFVDVWLQTYGVILFLEIQISLDCRQKYIFY